MTYCKKCKGMIGDFGDPHTCSVNTIPNNWPMNPYPAQTFKNGQKCDMCGSTAIDHTEAQCQINRQLKKNSL